ncbi:WD40 repeat-like protein [Calocera viscosa TUFC12733]|uniref:WD40 repeat-like protein n=1 Tax=Calocera viscosa (strain TUFC12733) TaxID=1330018 RepID=A0A167NVE4_CALVF|nr:WD40 repeat-like protein [Calocera viscosa TUFC12733]
MDSSSPSPSLSLAPGYTTHPCTHSTTPHPGAYVLELAPLREAYAVAFSAPYAIGLLDRGTLREAGALEGHEEGVTGLAVLGEGLLSASMDGSVIRWDPRARGRVSTLRPGFGKRTALLSVGAACDGVLVAAGTELVGDDAFVHFWDLRNPGKVLYSHSSTHSDDITCLSFHPSDPAQLLSASTDGLVSLTNAREADEDEAVVQVGNWGTSVARAGWDGAGTRVWARSDMETVSLWDGELALLHDFGDARRPAVEGKWTTDYVINCSFRAEDDGLILLAGSNEGSFSQISAGQNSWSLERTFDGGHTGIVRSVIVDEREGRVVSGGEDGKVAVWSVNSGDEMEVDVPRIPSPPREVKSPGIGEHRGRKKARYEPYGRKP